MRNTARSLRRLAVVAACPVALLSTQPPAGCASQPTLAIARSHYLDKVRGWWMGKIVGVTLGGPFEFRMPWPPKEVTGYVFDAPAADYFGDNDDLYVGMTYLLALDRRGPSVTQGEMAEEFLRRLEPRRLWLANHRAYMNLAAGLGPPKTGHPVFNEWSWSIDAQIDNDVWGVVCPGMIDTAREYADMASHITNYADGAYGGVFAAALASGAFVESDIGALIQAALATIPAGCDYAGAVRDVVEWHRRNPGDWKAARGKIKAKWQDERGHRQESAVLNGAAVVMALLYSGGDFDTAIRIAAMAGWDTDCNASTAGGVMGIIRGAEGIPTRWDIFNDRYKNISIRGLPMWMSISEIAAKIAALGEKTVAARGGRVEGGRLVIPVQTPVPPSRAEAPFPVGPRREAEWNDLRGEKLALDLRLWNPDLALSNCLADGATGLLREFKGKRHVFKTVPGPAPGPCVMAINRVAPAQPGEEIVMEISACAAGAPWDLAVAAGGKEVARIRIGEEAPPGLRATSIAPRRGEDIVLYVAEDGSTYFDEGLTRLAQPSEGYDPSRRPAPLRIRSAQNNVNLFKYPGLCPPGRPEIRSYFIEVEWTDSPYTVIWLSPGDPHPYGCYWPKEYVPDLPLPDPKPIKLRIRSEDELPSVPEGGKYVLAHDEGRATVIFLPRISTEPMPWYTARFDLAPYLKSEKSVEVRSFPAAGGRGGAYWGCVRLSRRQAAPGRGGHAPSARRQR